MLVQHSVEVNETSPFGMLEFAPIAANLRNPRGSNSNIGELIPFRMDFGRSLN